MAAPQPPAERYGQLDAIRALAALTVFLGHCLGMLPPAPYNQGPIAWFMQSPFRIAIAGHQAVIFFFLLSGFVLSLGFYRGRSSARPFLVNRVFRLYPPYLCALIATVAARWLIPMHPLPGFSDWINGFWLLEPLRATQLWPAATMLIDAHGPQLNPIAWSLIIEMRVSLLFPIIMVLLLRFGWLRSLAVACVLGLLAAIPSNSQSDVYATLQYGLFFVAGAVLAQHRAALIRRCQALRGTLLLSLLAVAVLLYTEVFWLAPTSALHIQPLDDLLTALGAGIIVVLALASPRAALVLPSGLRRLGKGAYSFYLYHFVVLLTVTHLFYGHAAIWQIWLLALICTILLSALMYRAIEVPSIAAGHHLARRLNATRGRPDAVRTAA